MFKPLPVLNTFVGRTTAEPGPASVASSIQTGNARVSLVRSILSFISFDGVSRIRQTSLRRGASEGLIAPRSPGPPPRSASLHLPSSPLLGTRSQYLPPPPRSPRRKSDVQEVDVSKVDNTEFKLNTTPRRRLQPNQSVLSLDITRKSGRSLLVEDE